MEIHTQQAYRTALILHRNVKLPSLTRHAFGGALAVALDASVECRSHDTGKHRVAYRSLEILAIQGASGTSAEVHQVVSSVNEEVDNLFLHDLCQEAAASHSL